jgi:UPF0176 protein
MPDLVTNISTYKFDSLGDLKALRRELATLCGDRRLKGTILLSTEGINLFVAGARDDIEALVRHLRAVPGLADLAPKYSESTHQPFHRMLVKIKKEIIAFGVEGIRPDLHTSPKLPARTLKQWLDEGRPITLLDTRNDYEIRLGTFKGAVPAGIDHFRNFPKAVAKLPPAMKEQPVVMFCTGGIRCEKAGPFMEREGFKNIFQLDGGILKYFEEVGGAHYDGECFVFDQRVGVDPALRETSSAVCLNCQAPLTVEEQQHPHYTPPHACPHCFRSTEEERADTLRARHTAIQRVTTPLPGSQPYENRRPFLVPPELEGTSLLDCLDQLFPYFTREAWLAACASGNLRDSANLPLDAGQAVRAGEYCVHVQPGNTEPDVSADIRILYEDAAIIVLHKPAPLPMHPSGRFNRNTLEYILNAAYTPYHPRAAHRLDANTTGLVVCARTRQIAGRLQPQFARGEVDKTYLVRVQGHPPTDAFRCEAPISDECREAGSRDVDTEDGRDALTEFRVIARHSDGSALLEAFPRTGRTNQIRVHLWHLGFPVCGDPSYLAGGRIGTTQTLAVDSVPLCLHALRLTFTHPLTGARVTFEDARPEWASLSC